MLLRTFGIGGGEVPVPAYQQLNENPRLAERVHEIMVMGMSTRKYAKVLPETAGTVGISRSSVSRKFIEASQTALTELMRRRFDDKDFLAIHVDGIIVDSPQIIAAIGGGQPPARNISWASQAARVRTPRSSQGSVAQTDRARPACGSPIPVCDRWFQSAALGHRGVFRRTGPRAAPPYALTAQRSRAPAQRERFAIRRDHEGGLQAVGRLWHHQARDTRGVAQGRPSGRLADTARGARGDVHGEQAGPAAGAHPWAGRPTSLRIRTARGA